MGEKLVRAFIAFASAATCGIAYAHPSHGDGTLAGLLHPLLGIDHWLAAVAIGIWAALLEKRAVWLAPLCFALLVALSAIAGLAGAALPLVDAGIAASILLAGLLIAFRVKLTPAASGAIVSLFAVFHGHAHGIEMPLLATPWMYIGGLLASTVALLGVGVLFGSVLRTRQISLSLTGSLIVASGGWLLAAF